MGIETSKPAVECVVSSSAFAEHAKAQGLEFNREDRRSEFDRVAEIYAEEIRFASEWVKRLPLWSSIPVALPAELIVDPAVENML